MLLKVPSSFSNRPYETQVIIMISFLATLRVVLAVALDILGPEFNGVEVITDSTLLVIFSTLLVFAYQKFSFQKVHPAVGVIIIVLLCLNFIQFGGTEGSVEFNYYAGIYVIVLLYYGRTMYLMLALQMTLLALIIYLQINHHPLIDVLFIHSYLGIPDFIFSITGIIFLTFYLKEITLVETKKFETLTAELDSKVIQAKKINQKLVQQGRALKSAQKNLEKEIEIRTASLQNQNTAVEKYIRYNTNALHEPLQQLTLAVSKFKNDSMLYSLMKISCDELNVVVSEIKNTLEADEELHRSKIQNR